MCLSFHHTIPSITGLQNVPHSTHTHTQALKIYHRRVIDTALLYPHFRGPMLKSSLRYLTKKYLRRDIQVSDREVRADRKGHDSVEDALATLELAQLKIKNGLAFGMPTRDTASFLTLLTEQGARVSMCDRTETIKRHAPLTVSSIPGESDGQVVAKVASLLKQGGRGFVFSHFVELGAAVQNYVPKELHRIPMVTPVAKAFDEKKCKVALQQLDQRLEMIKV